MQILIITKQEKEKEESTITTLLMEEEGIRSQEELEKIKTKKSKRKGKKKRGKKKEKEEEIREVWEPKTKGGMLPFSKPPKKHKPSKKPKVTHYKSCHEGNVKVWKKDGLTFYGGGTSRGLDTTQSAVYIDMRETDFPVIQGSGVLNSIVITPILPKAKGYINIITRDYSVPDLSGKDWLQIYNTLKESKPLNIICFCMGGHGRTGIALTIFGMISGALPNKTLEAVKVLRKLYCKNAVEGRSQLLYINQIAIALGIEEKKISSKDTDSVIEKLPISNKDFDAEVFDFNKDFEEEFKSHSPWNL